LERRLLRAIGRCIPLLLEQVGRLERELVEEGRRTEDDGAWVDPRDGRAGRRRGLAAGHLSTARLAGEAALQSQQAREVLGAQELAQVPLDQDLDGLVPEVLVKPLRRLVGVGPTVDQRVGVAVGLEAKRGDRPDQGEQDRHEDHRCRPLDRAPGNPCQHVPHRSKIRDLVGATNAVAAYQGGSPGLATKSRCRRLGLPGQA
jgi:hypothetical protein